MKVNWTKGLKGKDKEDMENAIRGSRMALERLRKLCGEFISELGTSTPEDFESPQWAYKRAYKDGQIYALRKVQTLLETK